MLCTKAMERASRNPMPTPHPTAIKSGPSEWGPGTSAFTFLRSSQRVARVGIGALVGPSPPLGFWKHLLFQPQLCFQAFSYDSEMDVPLAHFNYLDSLGSGSHSNEVPMIEMQTVLSNTRYPDPWKTGPPVTFFFLFQVFFSSAPCSQVLVHAVCVDPMALSATPISWASLPRSLLWITLQTSLKGNRKRGTFRVFLPTQSHLLSEPPWQCSHTLSVDGTFPAPPGMGRLLWKPAEPAARCQGRRSTTRQARCTDGWLNLLVRVESEHRAHLALCGAPPS